MDTLNTTNKVLVLYYLYLCHNTEWRYIRRYSNYANCIHMQQIWEYETGVPAMIEREEMETE